MGTVAMAPQGVSLSGGAGVDAGTPLDHEAAIEACARGERFALQALFDQEARCMLALALRTVRDPDLALQALCDGMTQVWRQAASFRREQGPGLAWILERVRQRAQALARHDHRSAVTWPDAWLDAGVSWAEVLAPDASGHVAAAGLRVPPEAWPRLLRQLGHQGGYPWAQVGTSMGHVPVRGWWRAGAMRVVISLSAMLCFGLGLLLAWGALTHEPGSGSEPGRYMAVLSSPQEQATWVLVVEQGRNLRLSPLSMLTPVRPGQQLMLWVRGATEVRPQAVGAVSPDKASTWALAQLPTLQGGQHVELTLEALLPGDALPRQPQGPLVAQGTLDAL